MKNTPHFDLFTPWARSGHAQVFTQNVYFTKVGTRGIHAMIEDSCVTCHMESTSPPPNLANKNADGTYGGTNHTFYASSTICTKCHSSITLEAVQGPVQAKMDALKAQIETAIKNVMQAQIRAGNTIDLGGTRAVRNASDITAIELIESHGRQGVNVTLAGGTKVSDLSLASVKVVRPAGAAVELYAVADPTLAKAGWNYFTVHSDKSKGVHNPAFVNSALDVSLFAVSSINSAAITRLPPGNDPATGGGIGNGAGAVSCDTPYVRPSSSGPRITKRGGSRRCHSSFCSWSTTRASSWQSRHVTPLAAGIELLTWRRSRVSTHHGAAVARRGGARLTSPRDEMLRRRMTARTTSAGGSLGLELVAETGIVF